MTLPTGPEGKPMTADSFNPLTDTPPSSQPASEPTCGCEGLWHDIEISIGPEARDSYSRTGHLPNCAVPALPDSDTRLKELIADVRDALRVTDDAQGLSSLAAIESFFAQQEARIRELGGTVDTLIKQGHEAFYDFNQETDRLNARIASLRTELERKDAGMRRLARWVIGSGAFDESFEEIEAFANSVLRSSHPGEASQ